MSAVIIQYVFPSSGHKPTERVRRAGDLLVTEDKDTTQKRCSHVKAFLIFNLFNIYLNSVSVEPTLKIVFSGKLLCRHLVVMAVCISPKVKVYLYAVVLKEY